MYFFLSVNKNFINFQNLFFKKIRLFKLIMYDFFCHRVNNEINRKWAKRVPIGKI